MAKGKTSKRSATQRKASEVTLPKGAIVHKLTRTAGPQLIALTPGDAGFAYSFTLNWFSGTAELTALYDNYIIDRVDIEWHLLTTPKNNTTGLPVYPVLSWTPDYDDDTAPVAAQEVMEYSTCKVAQFSATMPVIKTSLVPRVSKTVYNTAVQSGYALAEARCPVDTVNANVPHYGVKAWTRGYNSTDQVGGSIGMYTRFHLTMISTR